MRRSSFLLFLTLVLGAFAVFRVASTPAPAASHISTPRADGQTTPLLVYAAEGVTSGCAPLAVISHGAGGSEEGYRYLAQAMSRLGYTAVVMGHRESGLSALRADMRAHGFRQGVQALVVDPHAEETRLLDVGAALKWADRQCAAPFRVLLGHSMGAETVMLEAGAKNIIGVDPAVAGQDRFDAYVALSPEGPGIVFAEHAWSGIHKPMLILTGTRDQSLKGGPPVRQIPWRELPGNAAQCQWLGVVDGATHLNFAGTGIGSERVKPLVTQTVADFLAGVQAGACHLPQTGSAMTMQAK
jgi:predicted dienelactone hydrolase